MKKSQSKSPMVSYEYVPEKEQGGQLDMAFNILFEEVMKIKKSKTEVPNSDKIKLSTL